MFLNVLYLPMILMFLDTSYMLWPSSMFPNFFLSPILVFLYPTSTSNTIFQILIQRSVAIFSCQVCSYLTFSDIQPSTLKILIKEISHKIYFSVSRIWSSLIPPKKSPIKKLAEDLIRDFSKEDIQKWSTGT